MSYAEPVGRTVEVDGDVVHFHDVGTGPPLLMLPAFGPLPGTTAWLTYHRVIDAFAARFRCVLVDYPNFGRSSPVVFREPVHDLYVRQALGVLDALGIGTTAVLGVSTGGTVALDLALTAPGRVSRLVVGSCEASTGADPTTLAPSPSEVWRLFERCQGLPPDEGRIRQLLDAIVHDPGVLDPSLAGDLYRQRVEEPEHSAAWARSTSVPHGNLGELHRIGVPTLVVHGRHDRMVPLEQALRILAHLPAADLVVLNDCGHWPPVERPDLYTRFALPFLGDAP